MCVCVCVYVCVCMLWATSLLNDVGPSHDSQFLGLNREKSGVKPYSSKNGLESESVLKCDSNVTCVLVTYDFSHCGSFI